jgi:tRNA pseudouridine55 synthase
MPPSPGVFAVYKDEGLTSHDVVDVVRRLTGEKRVGHAGTLDPCAKGVLVIGVGRAATKRLSLAAGTEKEYVTRIRLGWRSTTDDREGVKEQVFQATEGRGQKAEDGTPAPGEPQTPSDERRDRIDAASLPPRPPSREIPTEEQVRQALARFQGIIDQRPPAFSAIKVRGRAAYKLARAARVVDLPARRVEVKEIELLKYTWPDVDVRLVTGPGFYVRSLARDLGETLGTGGYTEALERIRVGTYTKEQAVRLADLPSRIADLAPKRDE